ncbi:hypothetical protein IQ07DRAFT_632884 [Pyrenochaeta sp. DS3sAY3a]|nr:hypothetical protein IQ07DRAFT_632884 [Pyrenochaeta sp. DS3sAY3a]
MFSVKSLLLLCLPLAQAAAPKSDLCHYIGSALQITPNCVDPDYNIPIIDNEGILVTPEPHYRVQGHFDNTTIKFNYHFPLKDTTSGNIWEGRFYQWVYPTQEDTADDATIGIGLSSGAYMIQTTGTLGYRAEAASAKFSRIVAAQYYDLNPSTRIYGYIYGASGGSLQVIGALENTQGIWDGGVPIVQAIPASVSISQSVRAMAGLVLQNRSQDLEAALKPGGSGDPYAEMNQGQRDVLREVVQVGLPIATLEDFLYTVNRTALAQLRSSFVGVDPTYVNDFWTKEGYLGSEESPLGELFRSAVVEINATVLDVERDSQGIPIQVRLSPVPKSAAFDLDWDGKGYLFSIFAANGTRLGDLAGRFNHTTSTATFGVPENATNNALLYAHIESNATIHISNKQIIALSAFHRYQVPRPLEDRGYIGYNVLRNVDGIPLYPQRNLNAPKVLAQGASGGANHSGLIYGKAIVVQNLLDHDAFPWWADWYSQQVRKSLGHQYDESFRLWYNSHMTHEYGQPANAGLYVDYAGVYERALRSLSAWVEHGVAPPRTSNYTLTADNDIALPEVASQRGGVQPTVKVSLQLNDTLQAYTGETLSFTVSAEAPTDTGKIVALECDFLGNEEFSSLDLSEPVTAIIAQANFVYTRPGDYIVVVRVTSQRKEDFGTPFARVMNLGRLSLHVL